MTGRQRNYNEQWQRMIRPFEENDMEAVLDIWLAASIQAHSFVDPAVWRAQVDNMRTLYLPASQVYVAEDDSKTTGFYALHDNNLAAIFVRPACQGQGIGKALIAHAKQQRTELTLSVYKENHASVQFYLAQGFTPIAEAVDQHTGHPEYIMRTRKQQM